MDFCLQSFIIFRNCNSMVHLVQLFQQNLKLVRSFHFLWNIGVYISCNYSYYGSDILESQSMRSSWIIVFYNCSWFNPEYRYIIAMISWKEELYMLPTTCEISEEGQYLLPTVKQFFKGICYVQSSIFQKNVPW